MSIEEKTEITEDNEEITVAEKETVQAADGEMEEIQPTFESITNSTQEILKAQGYITVIKRFMSNIGKLCVGDVLTEGRLAVVVKDAERYGINGIIYTPFFMDAADAFFKKNPSAIKKTVLIDYPYGESSFEAKATGCAEAAKGAADSVVLTYPLAAERAGVAEEVKKQTAKIFKKPKKGTGVAINGNFPVEEIKAAFDLFADLPVDAFYLFADEITDKDLYATVKIAAVCKKDKKLFVVADVDDALSAAELLAAGANAIYTPSAEKIGAELVEMAGITL